LAREAAFRAGINAILAVALQYRQNRAYHDRVPRHNDPMDAIRVPNVQDPGEIGAIENESNDDRQVAQPQRQRRRLRR